jgi:hypothetical protein
LKKNHLLVCLHTIHVKSRTAKCQVTVTLLVQFSVKVNQKIGLLVLQILSSHSSTQWEVMSSRTDMGHMHWNYYVWLLKGWQNILKEWAQFLMQIRRDENKMIFPPIRKWLASNYQLAYISWFAWIWNVWFSVYFSWRPFVWNLRTVLAALWLDAGWDLQFDEICKLPHKHNIAARCCHCSNNLEKHLQRDKKKKTEKLHLGMRPSFTLIQNYTSLYPNLLIFRFLGGTEEDKRSWTSWSWINVKTA